MLNMHTASDEYISKHKWNQSKIAWCGIFLCLFLFVVKPSLYLIMTWCMLPFVAILFFYDDFYALWGMFLFFEDQLVIIPGISLFACYSFLIIIKFVALDRFEKKIAVSHIPAIVVILLYGFFAVTNADTSSAISKYLDKGIDPPPNFIINMRLLIGYLLDFVVIYVLALRVRSDNELIKKVFKIVVITAIYSGIYGYVTKNIFYYAGMDSGILRYMASFNDPNYASFFFNLALFCVYILEDFKSWKIKIPLLLIFYYFLIAAGSLSGIGFHIIGLLIYAILKYRQKAIGAIIIISIIGSIGLFTIMKVPVLNKISIVQSLTTRIELQFKKKSSTSLSEATSGRETQWKNYWGYFKEQSWEKKLFGGNIIMSYSIDQNLVKKFGNAPHQAYLSFLLNFGILGVVVFVGAFIAKVIVLGYMSMISYKDTSMLLIFVAFMWIFYGFGFDYFGDWRFMIFYFI